MSEVGFEEAFREAGGVRRRGSVPYPLTHEHIRAMCIKREDILRIQYPDEKLSDEAEAQLASFSLDDPDECFSRFKCLCALWYIWEEKYTARHDDGAAEPDLSRWMMMAREPVWVRIGNSRKVAIRSLSRGAMIRIERHDQARALLGEKLDWIEEQVVRQRELVKTRTIGRLHAWRRIRQLRALADRVEREIELHFRGILANALSETGRAMLPEEAPEWWGELGERDEVVIGQALLEAGPLRFSRGQKPRSASSAKADAKRLTLGGILRYWEPKLHLPPMALEDVDLAQVLTALEEGSAAGAQDEATREALQ